MSSLGIHSEELEQAILYSLLWYKELQPNIHKLDENDFYKTFHREVFREFKAILSREEELIPETVPPKLAGDPKFSGVLNKRPMQYEFKGLHKKLVDYSDMRKMHQLGQKLLSKTQGNIEPKSVRNWAITKLEEVKGIEIDSFKNQNDRIDSEYEELLNDTGKIVLKTGYPSLDRITNGFYRASLNIIASAQSMGKTSFMLNLIRNLCHKQGKSVLFMPLEMEFKEVHAKMVSLISGVDFNKSIFETEKLTTDELKRINNARAEIAKYKLYRIGEKEITPVDIELKLKELDEVDIIMVDYLQLMEPVSKYGNIREKITNLSREMKLLARKTGIPVVIISSINRDYSKRDDKKPRVTDLRESGQIEYDAGLILLLHRECMFRDADYKAGEDPEEFEKMMELIIAKNRFGQDGKIIKFYFEGKTSRLCESC